MGVLSRLRPTLRRPTRRRLRWAAAVLAALLLLPVAYRAARVFGGNRHEIIPGRVYRCGQPSAAELRELVQGRHVRTVVNLRGTAQHLGEPKNAWYRDEVLATHDLNVSQEDITFSANRLPAPAELRRLIDVLDHTEYPIVIHCKQGADRTGLASAVVLLLYTDASLAKARRQLWPHYGHVEFGRTAAIDDFFDRYAAWLDREGVAHTPERFRRWATEVYTPGPARSELTWLDPVPNPVPAGKPLGVRLRAVNRSTEAWEFKPGNYAGIHLSFTVGNEKLEVVHRGQAGLLRATVPPGGSIDLTLAVPGLPPGKYVLVAEMSDATGASVPVRASSFVQHGDESVMANLEVR